MKEDRLIPLSLLSVSIVFIVYSFRYKIGSINAPGVSFFPIVCAVGLAVLSSVLLFKNTRPVKNKLHSKDYKKSVREPVQVGKLWALAAVLVLFALFHGLLGFWVSVFGAMVALQRIAGVSSLKWSLFGGGATMALGYLVFERWMGAYFPEGVLGIIKSWIN